MRTTIRMDNALLIAAKQHATATHRSFAQLVLDGVVLLLEKERGTQSPRRVTLPVFHGDGTYPGIDINRNAALLDAMNGEGGELHP